MLIPELTTLLCCKRLEDREEARRILRHPAVFSDNLRTDTDTSAVFKNTKGVIRLAC